MNRKLIGFLFSPLLWRWILLLIFFSAIWFLGPLFAFSKWRPLEPVSHRVLIILLIVGYIIVRRVLAFWHTQQINNRFMRALSNNIAEGCPNNSALDELMSNFTLAMNHLKKSVSNSERGFFSRLHQRFVYQFPWYVFIGAPGSGKTTALINSGLQFPLLELTGRESLKGVGGTRNCDWWFTQDAVFIDTAGRYITHESNAQQDKDEWRGFLDLLKKFRPRQPLNGAVVTFSVADLLTSSEQAREKHAAIIRARLSELGHTLGINFPVYVLITKADLLGGFADYFSGLPKEERDQVLGFTFPDNLRNNTELKGQLKYELDLVLQRLLDGLHELMIKESDVSRRAHCFSFPQNFANCMPLIIDLANKVFGETDVSGVQLRGIYFTSGTQEGTPFDRVLNGLGRRFGVSSTINTTKKTAAGRSYFLKNLIAQVVLPESHLAGRNRREEKKAFWFGLGAHGFIFMAFFVGIALLIGSYSKNHDYLTVVDQRARQATEVLTQLSPMDRKELVDYMPLLNSLCCLADGETFTVESPPVEMTLGLYQGEKLDTANQHAYFRALQGTLLPFVARRLQQLLASSSDQDMDFSYQALKAYLMLNQPEHYNHQELLDFLEEYLIRQLSQDSSQDLSREQQAAIYFHLRQLFGVEAQVSPYVQDDALVRSKRRLLSSFSFAERAYQTIKSDLLRRSSIPEVSFLTKGGARSHFVFERKSGKPLSDGITGLFTRGGYHQIFLPAIGNQLSEIITEESWVLDAYSSIALSDGSLDRAAELEKALIRRYLQDYMSVWDSYLLDLRLISTRSISESVDVARILSSSDSPLMQLIEGIAPELSLGKELSQLSTLSSKEGKKRIAEKVPSFDQPMRGFVSNISQLNSPELIVDNHFKDLMELVYGENRDLEKKSLLKIFNEIYMSLSNADFSIRSGTRHLENSDLMARLRAKASRYPVPIRGILEELAGEGKKQTDNGIRRALSAELDSSIGDFCRIAIGSRYPFDRNSARDTTFADFSKLFAPAGIMDSFFNENLLAITDTSGRNWILRQAADVNLPIASFQQAAKIRDVFFAGGARTPTLNFELKVLEMDAGINQLSMDFDGQLFQYAHGPQIPRSVNWPGPLGSNQIRIELSGDGVNRKSLVVNGPWAVLRLFDLGERRHLQPEKFISTLAIHGHKVVLEITADSVYSPFYLPALEDFRCPIKS